MSLAFFGGTITMIVGRCRDCNYVARYNPRYFSVLELQKHTVSFPVEEQDECSHSLVYFQGDEEK